MVGVCTDLAEVVALSPPLQADVVLVDAELQDGAAAARRTHQIKPDIRLIAYAIRETKADVIAWAEAGVIGYIPNTAASADLVRLIVDVIEHRISISVPVLPLHRHSSERRLMGWTGCFPGRGSPSG